MRRGRTSSGAALYSVEGSLASSRASCIMRFTAVCCQDFGFGLSVSVIHSYSMRVIERTRVVLVERRPSSHHVQPNRLISSPSSLPTELCISRVYNLIILRNDVPRKAMRGRGVCDEQ